MFGGMSRSAGRKAAAWNKVTAPKGVSIAGMERLSAMKIKSCENKGQKRPGFFVMADGSEGASSHNLRIYAAFNNTFIGSPALRSWSSMATATNCSIR